MESRRGEHRHAQVESRGLWGLGFGVASRRCVGWASSFSPDEVEDLAAEGAGAMRSCAFGLTRLYVIVRRRLGHWELLLRFGTGGRPARPHPAKCWEAHSALCATGYRKAASSNPFITKTVSRFLLALPLL